MSECTDRRRFLERASASVIATTALAGARGLGVEEA